MCFDPPAEREGERFVRADQLRPGSVVIGLHFDRNLDVQHPAIISRSWGFGESHDRWCRIDYTVDGQAHEAKVLRHITFEVIG